MKLQMLFLVLLCAQLCKQNEIYGKTRISALGTYRGVYYNFTQLINNIYQQREPNLASIVPVEAYLGIRYGMITNRFMPPRLEKRLKNYNKKIKYRNDGFNDIITLNKYSPVCPQPLFTTLNNNNNDKFMNYYKKNYLNYLNKQSEDCLYLNIYRPEDPFDMNLKPVVVYIHGQSYIWGTGNAYNMSFLASMGRVLVVTLNYRLGPLGFLSYGDYRGNLALWDIQTALIWLKTFVSDFGGDPNEITLFGKGHGASLVSLLMSSPDTHVKSLFKRAILHSGSYMSSWGIVTNPPQYSTNFIEILSCNYTDINLVYKCLHDASIDDLNKATLDTNAPLYQEAFGPIEGDKLVEMNKRKSEFELKLATKNVTHDLLFGFDTTQSTIMTLNDDLLRANDFSQDKHKIFNEYIQNFVKLNYDYHHKFIEDTLMFHYDSSASIKNLINIINDHQIAIPLINFVENWQKRQRLKAKKYCFVFNQDQFYKETLNDIDYLLGVPIITEDLSVYSDVDRVLSEVMIQYWSNFIKYGSPNPIHILTTPQILFRTRSLALEWKEYTLDSQEYLLINSNKIKIESSLKTKEKYLFNNLLYELNKEKIENDSLKLSVLNNKHEKLAFHTIDFITNKMTTTTTPLIDLYQVLNDTLIQEDSWSFLPQNLFNNQNVVLIILFISLLVVFINIIIMFIVCHQKNKFKNLKANSDLIQNQQLLIEKQDGSRHGGSQDSSINTPVQSIPDSLLTTSTTNGGSKTSSTSNEFEHSSPIAQAYAIKYPQYNYLTMSSHHQKWVQSPSRRMLDTSTYKSFAFQEDNDEKKHLYSTTLPSSPKTYTHVHSRILDTVKKLDVDFNKMKLFNDSAEDVV